MTASIVNNITGSIVGGIWLFCVPLLCVNNQLNEAATQRLVFEPNKNDSNSIRIIIVV